jgi:hypothetical protein
MRIPSGNIPQPGYADKVLNNVGEEGWELITIAGSTGYLKSERVDARKGPEVKHFMRDGHHTGCEIG